MEVGRLSPATYGRDVKASSVTQSARRSCRRTRLGKKWKVGGVSGRDIRCLRKAELVLTDHVCKAANCVTTRSIHGANVRHRGGLACAPTTSTDGSPRDSASRSG
jgi:hypothetical protein